MLVHHVSNDIPKPISAICLFLRFHFISLHSTANPSQSLYQKLKSTSTSLAMPTQYISVLEGLILTLFYLPVSFVL